MRRFFAVAVCLIFALAPARAQGPAPAPDALAAARELVVTMRAADQMNAVLPMLMSQLKPVVTQGKPDAEKDYDSVMPQMIAAMKGRMSEFVDGVAVIYANHFTAAELRQLNSFYQQPVGQKFLSNMPAIMQDSMAMGQKFGASLAEDLRSRMTDELRKKGHKL